MLAYIKQHKWFPFIAISIIIFLATLIRLNNLDEATISHAETYIPGIELPPRLAVAPTPRMNLAKTVIATLHWDVHPPAYYIFMFFWTKCFGTSIFSIRLPSVIFGVASIILVYFLCTLFKQGKLTGVLSAGMLACNSTHIHWSQSARMYSMGCFLGILSTVFLLLLLNKNKRIQIYKLLYFISTMFGLATVIYFWPIFATHTLWSFCDIFKKKKSGAGLFRLQMFILVLASPLLSISLHQNRFRDPYISNSNLWHNFYQFSEFGFSFQSSYMPEFINLFLCIITPFLLLISLFSGTKLTKENKISKEPTFLFMITAVIVAFVSILAFAKVGHDYSQGKHTTTTLLILASSFIPILALLIDFFFQRNWKKIEKRMTSTNQKTTFLNSLIRIDVMLAIVPVTIITGISFFVTPLFMPRGVLLYAPYIIIILSWAISSLIRQNLLWITLIMVLMAACFFNIINYKHNYRRDYKGLAKQWTKEIQTSDLIFITPHWATTPIFYYLKGHKYHFVGYNYQDEVHRSPNARVWVLSVIYPKLTLTSDMIKALSNHFPMKTIEVKKLKAVLYVQNKS